MAKKLQAIRGMNDTLPEEIPLWSGVETVLREILTAYGYREIRFPIMEKTELFARSIGEVTDIVEKEMYTFYDRNGDSLTLRPEGTASCVRACMEHGLLHNQTQRLWYGGPMFRHERPQKGRYRQFHQIGAEAYGMAGPDIDAELIVMTARCWKQLGIEDVTLQLNSLGSPLARTVYREHLVTYSSLHFQGLRRLLDTLDIPYLINPRLVRGLDYYGKTVFEWVTERLGAQGTVCAGGRYDGLVEQLGGRPTPAVGFAIGLERLIAMLAESGYRGVDPSPHIYLVVAGEIAQSQGLTLAESLRDRLPQLRIEVNCGGGGFKAQLRRADRSGARWALILGEAEAAAERIAVKPLREAGEQQELPQQAVGEFFQDRLATVVKNTPSKSPPSWGGDF